MGKLVEREQESLKNMIDYCNSTIVLAAEAERILDTLVESPRITVAISAGLIRVLIDGEEDEFVDHVRRLIKPGFWERTFSDYSGQFEFRTKMGDIWWSVTPTAGARGCTIRQVQKTLQITRYESVCGEDTPVPV